MTDKPVIHATSADLDTEDKPEPFVYVTRSNKRVTFPDLFEEEWETAERFFADMDNEPNSVVLKKWLSDKDFAALKADKLSLRSIGILLQKVMNHYQGAFGDPGEDGASAS